MKKIIKQTTRQTCFLVLSLSLLVSANESYSPYVGHPYPKSVYWGDTHLHTNLSLDSDISGNRLLGPDDAYRFARGESVTAHNGMQAQLYRPLDFLVVADHAESLGVIASLRAADSALLKVDMGKKLYYLFLDYENNKKNSDEAIRTASEKKVADALTNFNDKKYAQSVWDSMIESADKYNEPGKFTAFSGYEWTSLGAKYNWDNIHRVVIFKDGGDKVSQVLPYSRVDSENPEDLWRFFERYEQKTGGEVLAIPHNGNTSNGKMFATVDFNAHPLSQAYAKTRSRWEPLYEVTQIKGDSETHPALSPNDEFADYETWNSWDGRTMKGIDTDGWIERKKSEYARSALKLGLDQKARLGVNPFKFGLIGSTDAHTSLAAAAENNFWGKTSNSEPHPNRMFTPIVSHWKPDPRNWEGSAGGYAAIWADENTREALFAAMKRKEVYATTGPRMTVRFFGGWDYQTNDAFKPDLANIGYRKGVPMGGDLTNAPDDKLPQFLIRAVKDPDGANLDRVQVIKGWHDKQGELHEKVYNVALSDNRKENRHGKVKPVGSTVNVKDASYTNSIGDPELAVVWTDPEFDKNELAFYYVRVLEIPTPRWTAYDAKYFGLTDIPGEVPMVTQERAYTSPIWYSPSTH